MTDVSVGFRSPCWCPSRWAPAWRLHTNLYKFGKMFLLISSVRKIAVTWILARVFAYLPSFYFQILDLNYWTVLIFYFHLFWMAWHWKPAIGDRKRDKILGRMEISRPLHWKAKILWQLDNLQNYKDLYEKLLERDWRAKRLLIQILPISNCHKNSPLKEINLKICM